MDLHVNEFYNESSSEFPKGNFKKVIALHEAPDVTFESMQKCGIPLISGWYELSRLSKEDRIEFTRDFWLANLPYHPNLQGFIYQFFKSLDDVGIFATKKIGQDHFELQMVYSLANNGGFYRGFLPATEEEITDLEKNFSECILPKDYISFLKIHNGFRKATDETGLLSSSQMSPKYLEFQQIVESIGGLVKTEKGRSVDPKTLIPFYESFGMPFFQCFWYDWYPQNVTGMGNVYFSVTEKTVSDPLNYDSRSSLNMAYTTFLDWLMFYLERIE